MSSPENLHNIEVLVFSNYAFSMEVLMNEHQLPSHFVWISLTTHEVILAISIWEKCFGFMIRPQRPETHVSFKKLGSGLWMVALQGSRQNILKLLHATGFEVIRFSVDYNTHIHHSEESVFGYSIRVPLTRVACKVDIFMKELNNFPTQLLTAHANAGPNQENTYFHESQSGFSSRHPDSFDVMEDTNEVATFQNNESGTSVTLSPPRDMPLQSVQTPRNKVFTYTSEMPNNSLTWNRVPLRAMDGLFNINENFTAYSTDNSTQVTETVRLSKEEVSAIIGPQGKRITMIGNATHCRISVLPVTLETMNSRFRKSDFPQTISLTGKPQQIAQAKVMIRRALLEFRSKQN
ncbi:hypothetical protein JCM33374_g4386 [Metschnikowia sp. JCM 33374]|nr:hypothetical protein JCM33374_g4386 [Metschnikowia sp. JCM 33374]